DDGTLALRELDLTVPAGEFFGLLGPNGAGKTTLINAVCNLIRVTAGELRVFGEPASSLAARRMIGLAEQEITLDRFLTVWVALIRGGRLIARDKPDALREAYGAASLADVYVKAMGAGSTSSS